MATKKMTNAQLMEILQAQNEKLAKLEEMLTAEKSAREIVESKIESAEHAAAEAERKRKDAEAKAKEFKERLEAKEAEGPAAQFDASIKCDFDFSVYAVPELGKWKTVRGDVKIQELVSISTADLYTVGLEFGTPIKYKRCLGQFGPDLVIVDYVHQPFRWIRREKTADELLIEIKHKLANQQFKNTLPKYEFPGDEQRILRKLPPVRTYTTKIEKTKTTNADTAGTTVDTSASASASASGKTTTTSATFDPEVILNVLAEAGLTGVYKRRREFKVTFENVSWKVTANARGGYTHYVGTKPVQTYATAKELMYAMVH